MRRFWHKFLYFAFFLVATPSLSCDLSNLQFDKLLDLVSSELSAIRSDDCTENHCTQEIIYKLGIESTEVLLRRKTAPNEFTNILSFDLDKYREKLDQKDQNKFCQAILGNPEFRIIVAEGITTWRLYESLKNIDTLTGNIPEFLRNEGSLAPGLYTFKMGQSRASLVEQMTTQQKLILEFAWSQRKADLPINSKKEILILASLIEKETATEKERKLIASVFINRLARGMPLQTDPSVIYGITKGQYSLGRGLRRSELRKDTPWNTYTNRGLPPGAIANPGRQSIIAAVQPANSDYLYFVADGEGGHLFASTLKEHNINVEQWRSAEKPNNCSLPNQGACSSDFLLCSLATFKTTPASLSSGFLMWKLGEYYKPYVDEAKRRGLSCGVGRPSESPRICSRNSPNQCSNKTLCDRAVTNSQGVLSWSTYSIPQKYVSEAKRRGLDCGVKAKVAEAPKYKLCRDDPAVCTDRSVCNFATGVPKGIKTWETRAAYMDHVSEAKRRGLSCGVKVSSASEKTCNLSNSVCRDPNLLCKFATNETGWKTLTSYQKYVSEAKRRGLDCGVGSPSEESFMLKKDIQKQLNLLGCNAGIVDGIFGKKTYAAINRVNKQTLKVSFDKNSLSSLRSALQILKQLKASDVCNQNLVNSTEKTCVPDSPEFCTDSVLCSLGKNKSGGWETSGTFGIYASEAKRRGLSCNSNSAKKATTNSNKKQTSKTSSSEKDDDVDAGLIIRLGACAAGLATANWWLCL